MTDTIVISWCFLALIAMFMAGIHIGGIRLDTLATACIFVLMLFALPTLKMPASVLIVVLLLFTHGIISILIGNVSIGSFLRAYIGLLLPYCVFSFALAVKSSPYLPVHTYMSICFWVAIIGWVQIASYFVGFQHGYDYSYIFSGPTTVKGGLFGIRVSSILPEPSHVATTLGAALSISIIRVLGKLKSFISIKRAIIVIGFGILSGSSLVYMIIGITALICAIRINARMIAIFGLITIIILYLEPTKEIQHQSDRLVALFELLSAGFSFEYFSALSDSSTYSLYIHAVTAVDSFKNTFGFGGGIGSHSQSFEMAASRLSSNAPIVYQVTTAGNLINRLISEIGIFGVIIIGLFFAVLIRRTIYLPNERAYLELALLIGMSAFFMRNGAYSSYGMAFYVITWMRIRHVQLSTPHQTSTSTSNAIG